MQSTGEIRACGEEDPSRVCTQVYEWTGSETLAGLTQWVVERPLRVALILIVAWLLNRLSRRAIDRLSDRIRETPSNPRLQALRNLGPGGSDMASAEANRAPARAEAIESVLKSLVTAMIFSVAIMLMLAEFGINLAPLLAGAGIVGVAIGFGAQSVVSDFLSGTFMLIEDQYGVGDIIEVDGVTGEVEHISLRTTKIRDLSGTVWHIPNGTMTKVGNHSQLWSNAIVDVDVSYDTDLRVAMELMDEVADGYWEETHRDDTVSDTIIEDPVVMGVQTLGDSGITLRLRVKTNPSDQWSVERELRLRLKEAFDGAGIEIPFPQRVVRVQAEAPLDDLG